MDPRVSARGARDVMGSSERGITVAEVGEAARTLGRAQVVCASLGRPTQVATPGPLNRRKMGQMIDRPCYGFGFDAQSVTDRLQDAVRRHDRAVLEQLVSEKFALVSGRSLGRMGKQEWIAAGMSVEWRSFVVSIARVIEIENVVVVDHDIEQEMEAPPGWAADAPTHTRWATTDVWAAEGGEWRLACRHPELAQ